MTIQLTIDSSGRIVIPKPLRDAIGLAPGDTLELESVGHDITLRPARNCSPLTKEKGVWVFRTGQKLSATAVDDVLDRVRGERDEQNLGGYD